MVQSWISQGPLSVCETRFGHRVFPAPSKIPYGGFSPVRLQTRRRRPPSPERPAYRTPESKRRLLWRRSACERRFRNGRSRPEALGSPAGCVVPQDHRLLWPHPSHSRPHPGLFASSGVDLWSRVGPQFELHVRSCLPSPAPRWTVAGHDCYSPRRIGLHLICRGSTSTTPRTLVPTWLCNEAESGSLSLRPARLLALHQQGRLLPSFRRTSRLGRRRLSLHRQQSTPTTGLSPAGQTAVWAASR